MTTKRLLLVTALTVVFLRPLPASAVRACVCVDYSVDRGLVTCETGKADSDCTAGNDAFGGCHVCEVTPEDCQQSPKTLFTAPQSLKSCAQPAPQVPAEPEGPPVPIEFRSPRLGIPIPGLPVEFSKLEFQGPQGGRYLLIPWLAQYIVGVVNFLLGIVLLVATVMIIAAGFMWLMAGGAPEKITDAKKRITNAVIGLTLALATYLLLNLINPKLTSFEALKIGFVDREQLNTGGDTEERSAVSRETNQSLGIYCPESGGAEVISQIVESFRGKAAYRFGGKGRADQPPFHAGEPDATRNFCPEGNLCLDCSGFVDVVYRCAGLPALPGGSGSIFTSGAGTELIPPGGLDKNGNTANGVPLQVGDLLGWLASDVTAEELAAGRRAVGHVFIYLGDGKIVENTSRNAGRKAGNNPQFSNLRDYPFPIRRIRRVAPPVAP